jgi:histidinol-phosphate aminotransferase
MESTAQTGMEIYNKLLHQGVIVRPVENYGLPNHLRVTVGLKQENEKFIRALESILSAMDVDA